MLAVIDNKADRNSLGGTRFQRDRLIGPTVEPVPRDVPNRSCSEAGHRHGERGQPPRIGLVIVGEVEP
jgi:hypothetical protein